MQMKIYYGESSIVVSDEKDTASITKEQMFIEVKEPTKKALKSLLANFKDGLTENYLFVVKNVPKFFNSFCEAFTSIAAAGGIVQNSKKAVLFIYRLEKWDLPKGKIEENENPATAAAREITEETGVKDLVLTEAICKTYHIYNAFGNAYLKTTHWFHFTTKARQKLKAQVEENITQVKWIPTIDINTPVANTYQNIKDVLATYFDKP